MRCFLPFLAITLVLLTGLRATAQVTPKQTELAEQLMAELNVDKTMESALAQVAKMQAQMLDAKNLSPEAKEKMAKTMKTVSEETKSIFSWNALKPAFIQIYAQTFTEEELQGMIDFFKTPIGQKWIEKQPQLQAATMQKMQMIMTEAQPKIQEAVRKASAGEKMGGVSEEIHPPFVP